MADRRKMFELAAVRDGAPQRTMSRFDLRQVRQDALAEYVERKTGVRREGGPRNGTRPRSAFFQHENGSHSGEGRLPDRRQRRWTFYFYTFVKEWVQLGGILDVSLSHW